MNQSLAETGYVNEEDYLAAEALADEKHEYLNGWVYVLHRDPVTGMAGASESHVNITGNAYYALRTHLKQTPCSTYMTDMRLKINAEDTAWFYPDVMVSCDPEDRQHKNVKYAPILIIEVLSKSTKNYDKGGKFDAYRQLTSLREYVLIDPARYLVEVFRLNEHQRWELFTFAGEDAAVELNSIDLRCTMAELYEEVDFSSTSPLAS